LCNDKCGEEDNERAGKDERENARTETRIDDVNNRDRMDAARDEGELFAYYAEEQYERDDLRTR